MTDVKAHERAVLDFFEVLLKLEYPGRRVAVTPAPFSDELPAEVIGQIDGSGVLDVTIGPLDSHPAWAAFRCTVQPEVSRGDWPEAARLLLERAREAFVGEIPIAAFNEVDRDLVRTLREAARRANWDAREGPQHLRTGRFTPGKGSGHGE
jgi:hypothetical protein